MPNPIFSAVAPAIKKEFYKMCYDSFSMAAEIPFEMIFVGPSPPTEFIGKHFKYIDSTVKPSQCVEIGARAAQGEYIITTADDITYSDGFLNKLYQEILITDTHRYLLSAMDLPPKKLGHDPVKGVESFKQGNYFGVKIGQCPCFPREIWKQIGGVDRRFIHTYFDIDLQFRCYEIGLSFKLAQDIYAREILPEICGEEEVKFRDNLLSVRYGNYHSTLLEFLWKNADGSFSNKRKLPVEPFEDKDILTISQGEKGEWN